ncbi:MAG: tail fiber domain-containing protein, partial [Rhodothermales bacterium]
TTASGSYSLAMGQSTTASGSYSLAMGQSTTASVGNSVAMGSQTTASNFYATAMGKSTTASGQASTAMGDNTEASGNRSTAMGGFTTASGLTSTAIGLSTTASGVNSTAMGDGTTASGENSTALGSNTTASGINTTAMGGTTTALGWYSTTMGVQTIAQANASLVLGRNNVITGTINSWVSTDPVLVVGNGSSTANRANAFTLLKNGNLTIAGTLTQNSDRRLKTDIHPLSDALSAIMRLQPVRYRFRAGTNRPQGVQIGLIAQEVQAVFPELVREEADGYLSLSYANLSAVLVQALKEQQAQIDTLQERLERLEIMLLQASTGSETVSSDQ